MKDSNLVKKQWSNNNEDMSEGDIIEGNIEQNRVEVP